MRQSPMAGFVEQLAAKYEIPGVAVAIWTKGKEYVTCHGVTDLDRPEPIGPGTPFLVASVTKTFTATAMMRLVASQQVDLDAPVQRYLPDFAVADLSASAEITVLNLLNHTAGLDWRSPDQPDDSDMRSPATCRPCATSNSSQLLVSACRTARADTTSQGESSKSSLV
jgi:CubicO group peptidase (beta-lactamase class C family)